MTRYAINGEEYRNQPSVRPHVWGDRWRRELQARAVAKRELDEQLRRPLIPPHKRLKEYGP